MLTGRPLQLRGICPTHFSQEQAQCLGPYTPDPWLATNFEEPKYQPGSWTGIGPTIRTGRKTGKGNPAANTNHFSTLTK